MLHNPKDTLVATQALVAYTERDTSRNFYGMQFEFTMPAETSWKRVVNLKQDNIGKAHTIKVTHSSITQHFYYHSIIIYSIIIPYNDKVQCVNNLLKINNI